MDSQAPASGFNAETQHANVQLKKIQRLREKEMYQSSGEDEMEQDYGGREDIGQQGSGTESDSDDDKKRNNKGTQKRNEDVGASSRLFKCAMRLNSMMESVLQHQQTLLHQQQFLLKHSTRWSSGAVLRPDPNNENSPSNLPQKSSESIPRPSIVGSNRNPKKRLVQPTEDRDDCMVQERRPKQAKIQKLDFKFDKSTIGLVSKTKGRHSWNGPEPLHDWLNRSAELSSRSSDSVCLDAKVDRDQGVGKNERDKPLQLQDETRLEKQMESQIPNEPEEKRKQDDDFRTVLLAVRQMDRPAGHNPNQRGFSCEEDISLFNGIEQFGYGEWSKIISSGRFPRHRNHDSLKERCKTLKRREGLSKVIKNYLSRKETEKKNCRKP